MEEVQGEEGTGYGAERAMRENVGAEQNRVGVVFEAFKGW